MKKLRVYILVLCISLIAQNAQAFWIWTPETNQWINPKYSVKETPQEQLEYAMEFYNAEDYKQATVELKKLLKHYPKAREAADAQYFLGMTLEVQGHLYNAFKSYQLVIDRYPFSERAQEVVKKQYDLANQILDGRDKQNKFVKTVVGGDYNVIEIFRTVIKNAPYGEYAPPSQYKIGLYLMEKKLYQEARDEFEKAINDYPESEWAKAAKFQIANSDAKRSASAQYDQKITEAAVEEFKEFVKIYPEAELSEAAVNEIARLKEKEAENHFIIAEYYEKRKKYAAAKIYYNTIVEDYQGSPWAAKALEKIREINPKIE